MSGTIEREQDRRIGLSIRGVGKFMSDAWRLAAPYFKSEERWSAWGLLLLVVVLSLSMVGMNVVLNFWNRAFFNALQDKDWNSFIGLLFLYKRTPSGIMPGFCAIVFVYIVVSVYRAYLNQWLQIRWRRWMTSRFLDDWLADRAYYRISLGNGSGQDAAPGTENPDQRIAEDLRDFIGDSLVGTRGILSLGLDLMSNVVTLFSFLSILWTLSGSITILGIDIPGYMVWVALLYSIIGTWLTHLVGRQLAMLNFRKQRVEADFRFALVRLRENMEGVALYGGEAEEKRGLTTRFTAVVVNWWALMKRTKALNSLIAGYGQIAGIFPIVVVSPRFFSGALTLGDLTQTADAFGNVQGAMSWVVDAYSSLAVWRATVERLATFQNAIDAARAAARTEGVRGGPSPDDSFRLDDVTLALPGGETILAHTAMVLPRGRSVVLSGRSGSGKSTLFRAIAGIWPFGSGRVLRPDGSVLFLPQRPYLPLGTLRHAVAYPSDATMFEDATIRQALHDVGLDNIADRLDHEDNWSQRLSGGEQQRLAIARALVIRPDWLFLDEATASLDPESEAIVYAAIQQRLPATTIVSISHRPSVNTLHDRRLVFERSSGQAGRIVEPEAAAAAD
jgi:putative ATP-binding cassette transporter